MLELDGFLIQHFSGIDPGAAGAGAEAVDDFDVAV